MPDKPTITSLTVTEGFGQNFLRCEFDDPNAEGGLLALRLDAIEFWAASTNDRSLASKVTEGLNEAVHVLPTGAARYYWTKPRLHGRDASGNPTYGDWYPAGAAAGVAAEQTASIASPGYLKFPSDVKLQWGYATTVGGEASATFSSAVLFGIFANCAIVSRDDGSVGPNYPNLEAWSVTVKAVSIVGSDWSVVFQVRKLVASGIEGVAGNVTFRRAPDGTIVQFLIVGG